MSSKYKLVNYNQCLTSPSSIWPSCIYPEIHRIERTPTSYFFLCHFKGRQWMCSDEGETVGKQRDSLWNLNTKQCQRMYFTALFWTSFRENHLYLLKPVPVRYDQINIGPNKICTAACKPYSNCATNSASKD